MANSATLLADLIDSWAVPANTTPEEHRGAGQSTSTLDFWDSHLRAAQLLVEVEAALNAMEAMGEDVAHFRLAQPSWYAAVFAVPTPWGSKANGRRGVAAVPYVALLRALGQQLDSLKYTPSDAAVDLENLRQAIGEAHELVIGSSIDDSVKRYVLGLVAEARACLDDLAAFGTVRLRNATFTLAGAMELAAETAGVPEEERPKWRHAAKRVLFTFANQTAAGITAGVTLAQIMPPG